MTSRCTAAAVVGLMAMGCTGSGGAVPANTDSEAATEGIESVSAPTAPAGGSACDWLTDETISRAVPGTATAEPPVDPQVDVWSCGWRSADTELTIRFDRFEPGSRSVEASLLNLENHGEQEIVTVAGLRGLFLRPGVWSGATPLEQYGIATIRLTPADGSEPEQTNFELIVSSVLTDVAVAAPHVPW